MSQPVTRHIVSVHGMWMDGVEATFLRTRLAERYGFFVHQLHHRNVRSTLDENTAALRAFVEDEVRVRADDHCHFLAHGLGGLITLNLLATWPDAPDGHVVCLGTPLTSDAAARVAEQPGVNTQMGASIAEGVLKRSREAWSDRLITRKIGVIAGTHSLGGGQHLRPLPLPNDGTVSVAETRHAIVDAHLEVAASHTGLTTSREVADQIAHFLNHGTFRASLTQS